MPGIAEVKNYLAQYQVEVREFSQPTPTAPTAAEAVGCSVAEIAKTLIFLIGGNPVAVVTCGDMKVKSSLLKQASGLSGKVRLPQAADVEAITGYLPGGVCPFLLPADLPIFLDHSLQRFTTLYPAAGNDYSAAVLTLEQLASLTGGQPAEVCVPF